MSWFRLVASDRCEHYAKKLSIYALRGWTVVWVRTEEAFKVFTFSQLADEPSFFNFSRNLLRCSPGWNPSYINLWISIAFVCFSIKATSFPISNKNSLWRGRICEFHVHCMAKLSAERWCDPQKQKKFATLRKIPSAVGKKSFYFCLADATTSNEQTTEKSAINFVCFTGGTTGDKSTKSHLDFSDLIMEIESIIFYTCYEINIVWSWSGFPKRKTRETECYKISEADYVAFLCSDCCAAGKNFENIFIYFRVKHTKHIRLVAGVESMECKTPMRLASPLYKPPNCLKSPNQSLTQEMY